MPATEFPAINSALRTTPKVLDGGSASTRSAFPSTPPLTKRLPLHAAFSPSLCNAAGRARFTRPQSCIGLPKHTPPFRAAAWHAQVARLPLPCHPGGS